MQLNTSLKDQLEESHHTNETLTNDLQKLSNEWDSMREELLIKEDEWKEEELAFNEYYTSEHNRLLNLWRNVVSVKRLFSDVKTSTERDLSKLRNEISIVSNFMVSACTSTKFAVKMQMAAAQPIVSIIISFSFHFLESYLIFLLLIISLDATVVSTNSKCIRLKSRNRFNKTTI